MAPTFPRLDGARMVAGVGSALVDVLLQEDDDFLVRTGAQKGGMTLVESGRIEEVLATTSTTPSVVCGGSACNTIVGIGKLGGPAKFIGKCGTDELAKLFEHDLRGNGVEPRLFKSDSPTGRVLSIITPDAQRSMLTCLGASAETKPEEITPEELEGAAVVHIEGYLLFNEALLRAALEAAREAGAFVSLDLASYTVVEAAKGILADVVKEFVDILIANEDEARVYTGSSDEQKALEQLADHANIAVLKLGKRGSLIARGDERVTVERMGSGAAVDTTGAGDLWAAGFLYGLVNGLDLQAAGNLGSACGYEVCQIVGAQIPHEGWQRIRQTVN
ncbi:MAG: adenosine kinase [Chitinivibrionales bacterium]|nr:adenosine kinase [Chitinivibrionales bacterium]